MTTSDTAMITYLIYRGIKEVQIEVPVTATLKLKKVKGTTTHKLLVHDGGEVVACFTEVSSFYPEYMEPKKQEFAGGS